MSYDVFCNECGQGMRWGEEYPIRGNRTDDTDALCPDCYHDPEVDP